MRYSVIRMTHYLSTTSYVFQLNSSSSRKPLIYGGSGRRRSLLGRVLLPHAPQKSGDRNVRMSRMKNRRKLNRSDDDDEKEHFIVNFDDDDDRRSNDNRNNDSPTNRSVTE